VPILPLGINAYKRSTGMVPEVRLVNLYVEPDKSGISPDDTLRIQRPGYFTTRTFDSSIRALDYRVGFAEQIAIAGLTLYVNGASKGVIPGNGVVPTVSTTFNYAAVADGKVHLYDGSTVSALTLPDGYLAQDVDQLNQYVLVLTSGGSGRFYWIVPGETTIDALNYATAESSPDGAVAVRRVGDELWFFGTDTIEVWQATGDQDAPFQRASGRLYERGCLARDTVRRFDNSVMWVADNGEVCKGGAVPQVVSDNGLTERIRKRGGDLSAWVFGIDGHEFYALNVPGQGTFCFDASTALWCEFASFRKTGWLPTVGYENAGQVFCGGVDGKVWRLDPEADQDDGQVIERTITASIAVAGASQPNTSLSLGIGASADTTVRVRWRDGQDDYPAYYDTLPIRAGFDVASMYRLGTPRQPYREFEISFVGPERVRIAGAMVNSAWQ